MRVVWEMATRIEQVVSMFANIEQAASKMRESIFSRLMTETTLS